MKMLERILFQRPGILNILNCAGLVAPTSQTTEEELRAIEKYAGGSRIALEIGSYQGVSAARIAAVMTADGILYCVDPWPSSNGRRNSCYCIFERHLRRSGLLSKIRVVRNVSLEAQTMIPDGIDFAFVDGDHSWNGIQIDWSIVRKKLRAGGIVCLHDSFVPPGEPWRNPDSVRFFQEVIGLDSEFILVEQVYTLAVLRRVSTKQPGVL